MTTPNKPRSRKPQDFNAVRHAQHGLDSSCLPGFIVIGGSWIPLSIAKRFHNWLGRAITWKEAQDD